MKSIVEQSVGGDGGKVGLYIDGANLALMAIYPLGKVLEPVNAVIDKAIDALEKAIPGEWDRALLEPIRVEAKAALVKLLAE